MSTSAPVRMEPLPEESLTRYRLAHPDAVVKNLSRRIFQLHDSPVLAAPAAPGPNGVEKGSAAEDTDAEAEAERRRAREAELTEIELLKWKGGVERSVACVRNLERQAGKYRDMARDTVRKKEELEATLEEEKKLLQTKLQERARQIECDAIYAKIVERARTRAELEEQIASVRAQVASHSESHAAHLAVAQRRIELFATVSPIVEEVKNMRLPVDTSVVPEDEAAEAEPGMDVDEPSGGGPVAAAQEDPRGAGAGAGPAAGGPSSRLSGAALPFQPPTAPSGASGSSGSGANRGEGSRRALSARTSPAAPGSGSGSGSGSGPSQPSQLTRAASHALPVRPKAQQSVALPAGPSRGSRAVSAGGGGVGSSVPSRPSGLRNSTTPGPGRGLEEGEVDGHEEGEVGSGATSATGSPGPGATGAGSGQGAEEQARRRNRRGGRGRNGAR